MLSQREKAFLQAGSVVIAHTLGCDVTGLEVSASPIRKPPPSGWGDDVTIPSARQALVTKARDDAEDRDEVIPGRPWPEIKAEIRAAVRRKNFAAMKAALRSRRPQVKARTADGWEAATIAEAGLAAVARARGGSYLDPDPEALPAIKGRVAEAVSPMAAKLVAENWQAIAFLAEQIQWGTLSGHAALRAIEAMS